MGEQRVFDGAHLRAELHGTGQAGLFVSFDHYRSDRKGFVAMSPVQSALDLGYANLVISTAANDWFLNPDLPALRAAISAVADQFPVVRAMGFSMGGYGALLLARSLRLSFATLWAPQVSLRHRVAPFENRWRFEARRIDRVADQLRLHVPADLQGVILCDPFANKAERPHARAIQSLAPTMAIAALPFTGHPPTHVFVQGSGYRSLLTAAITGTICVPMIRQTYRAHRWATELYLRGLDKALRQRETTIFARTGS